jgi:hypothetical protein
MLHFVASGEGHVYAAHKIWLQRATTKIYSIEFYRDSWML